MSKRLPSITSNIPRDLRNFVDRLRELVGGGGEGRLVTAKELVDAGVVNIDVYGDLSAATTTTVFGSPPAPTGVTATPAIRNVIVEWDNPTYPTHAYAEVWGASTDDIGDAVLLGQTPGAVYADELGPSATRYYWVRFINTQFTAGPYNDTAGTSATTGGDLAYTMDLLRDTYGGSSEAPFFQLDEDTVINGVTVSAGTYMKSAFIYDAEITNAKIANLAVDDAKVSDLSASKLTAGAISVGEYIESSDYVSATSGWRIDGNGSLEANNGTFRGALAAATGTFAGSLSAATGTFAGSLSAATGTFAGSLSAATGSFSGEIAVGTSPEISGTTMTGAGAKIYDDGKFVVGDSGNNINWDGSALTINGDIIGTNNLNGVAIGQIIAGSFNFVIVSSTGTFTVPAYVYKLKVTLIGAGGGGGYGASGSGTGSGGGGGGGLIKVFTVVPGDVFSVTIGSGGAAGTSGSRTGATGGSSVFTRSSGSTYITLTANGGTGGYGNNPTTAGSGGSATGGDLNIQGANGMCLFIWGVGNTASPGGGAPFIGVSGSPGTSPSANTGTGGSGGGVSVSTTSGASGLCIIEY